MLEVIHRDGFALAGALDAGRPREGSSAGAPGGVVQAGIRASFTDRWREKGDVMACKDGAFTRAVLLDMARHKGVHFLGDEEAFYPRRFGGFGEASGLAMRERGVAILGAGVVQDVSPSRLEGDTAAQPRRCILLLTINPLRVPGSTGGPVTAIATF